jgi:hypothetical protein
VAPERWRMTEYCCGSPIVGILAIVAGFPILMLLCALVSVVAYLGLRVTRR